MLLSNQCEIAYRNICCSDLSRWLAHPPFSGAMAERAEQEIELTIEAVTGTVYDLCVSPFETILGIKTKIQRLEGLNQSMESDVQNYALS